MRIAGVYTRRCKICGAELTEHKWGAYCRDCFNAKSRADKKRRREGTWKKAEHNSGRGLSAVAAEAKRRHMTYGQLVASGWVTI